MRQSDGLPPDPEMLAELETIDLTLAGLAIDPAYAEIAELTLVTAAERPRISATFAAELDARVQRRFEATQATHDVAGPPSATPHRAPPRRRRRRGGRLGAVLRRPAFGGGVIAGLAAVALAIVIVANSSDRLPQSSGAAVPSVGRTLSETPAPSAKPSAGVTHGAASTGAFSTPSLAVSPSTNAAAGSTSSAGGSAGSSAPSPAPVPNGRREVQSAQLQLSASNARLDTVSQEVYDVVGQENGIVKNSSVTSASASDSGSSYATFTLSIPSQNLQATMTRLSELRYATVASRTDATQDVNDQYLNDERRLADARALRTSLLKQLQAAITEADIDSLTAQIHDAEASISSDEATLSKLQSRISFSSLSVQINASPVILHPQPATSKATGFTIGRAAHDSVRVLTVAAGVALIALAALVPFVLLVALIAWVGYWLRRRRREHALDTA